MKEKYRIILEGEEIGDFKIITKKYCIDQA